MGQKIIKEIRARQVFSGRNYPAIEATVITDSSAIGTAQCTAGASVGKYEVPFMYDGGSKWHGRGVSRAVNNILDIIAPALIGMDVTDQRAIDTTLLSLCDGRAKEVLGGNALGAVSAAALKAGASARGVPLYYHIGGDAAITLPCPSDGSVIGSNRYLPIKCGKPTYSFVAYDFSSFSEACDAIWEISSAWADLLTEKWGLYPKVPCHGFPSGRFTSVPPGFVDSDAELWDMMTELIYQHGYDGKVGLQVDIAAESFFNPETGIFQGIFDNKKRDRSELIGFISEMCKEYSFVIIEDPLNEDDYEGHAYLTERTGIQVVGDDLFTTNPDRLKLGIAANACNAVLLKVYQIGCFSEAVDMVDIAYRNGYNVMPCTSRGEGLEICDYSVGLNATTIRESCFGSAANRFLQIERELGRRAVFKGKSGINGRNTLNSFG